MILVDTSVWIDFLRGSQTPATDFVRTHVGVDLATSEPVLMELLSGASAGPQAERAELLMHGQAWLGVEPRLDYRGAVDVFHATRSSGHQPRSLQDCLLAAIALRHRVALAHRDIDFERISVATGLRCHDLRPA